MIVRWACQHIVLGLALLLGVACTTAPQAQPPASRSAEPPVKPIVEIKVEPPKTEISEVVEVPWIDAPLEVPWGLEDKGRSWWAVETSTPTYDLPLSEDPSVQLWLDTIEGRSRKLYRIWLARSSRYAGLFEAVFTKRNLPKDLIFLAMVESGFSPSAFSRAAASGPWQFMPVTARRYGLRVGFWVDERKDFEKSTEAAATHLSWLYSVFEDWHLAMAAYNAGAGRVKTSLQRARINDFWLLQKTKRLKRETRDYVPKILATAIVAKNPEKFGFTDIPYLPPLRFSRIVVEDAVSLADVAEACGGLPVEVLVELNPSLRVQVTPPGESWSLRVPVGMERACKRGLEAIPTSMRTTYRYYERQEDESLSDVARKMGTTVQAILYFHGVESEDALFGALEFAVPVPVSEKKGIEIHKPRTDLLRASRYGPGKMRLVVHRVKTNDSLWKLSQRYGVSISKIRGWNALRDSGLQIDQRLRLYIGDSRVAVPKKKDRRAVTDFEMVKVQSGDSLWKIARRYSTTIEQLRNYNDLSRGGVLAEGMELRVPRMGK